ncbi:MAG: hypothetical protein OXD31_00615 [Chloroflexi bacterium]|nr:hypothetical protein [Chloroflexota bacterium]
MIFEPLMHELLQLTSSQAREVADVGMVVAREWAQQLHFEDKSVNAGLDFSRSMMRVFMVITVGAVMPMYWVFLMVMLATAGGDPRRLERVRHAFWALVQALALMVTAYVVVNFSVTFAFLISGVADVVLFWDPMIFETGDFSLDKVLQDEVALEGEVLMLFGDSETILCESALDPTAVDAGWSYVPDIAGTGIPGCVL